MVPYSTAELKRRTTTFAGHVVDFLFPPQCPVCGNETDREGAVETLCRACVAALGPVAADRCRRCSAPVGPHLDTSAGCVHCSGDVYSFERAMSLGTYRDWLRTAVLSAKQSGGGPAAAALARVFCNREESELRRLGIDLIVPVPHHWWDRTTRAHLAPVTLSRIIANRLRIRWRGGTLRKVRHTPKQVDLTPTDRRRNLRGAFRVARRSRLAGRTILLVDDVLTTGTTAHCATRALKQAGAEPVYVAAMARGVGND